MFYYLQTAEGIKKIIPNVEQVKEKIVQKEQVLDNYFDVFLRGLVDFAPKVISAIIVLFIGLWLIKRIARLTEKAMAKRNLEVSLRTFLKSLVSIGLKIILIVTVAGMLGIGTASFVTILGAAGLAVGLALQGSLSNFAGGVLILIFKPFKVGDSIEAGGQSGEVKEIQIFNTILLTADHKTVILPNGPLSNGTIVNTTRHGNLRVDVHVIISSENNLEKAQTIIQQVLENNDKILLDPRPGIFIGKISDGAVNINIKPYCHPANTVALTSELYSELKTAFDKHHILPAVQQRIVQNK
ncbi:MAG: mechanosensitive ion channel [Bacteroidia bacterium]|nr:mechanosensitive ion channel [Bacteroidia bacterium]